MRLRSLLTISFWVAIFSTALFSFSTLSAGQAEALLQDEHSALGLSDYSPVATATPVVLELLPLRPGLGRGLPPSRCHLEQVVSPDVDAESSTFDSVTVVSSHDVWAVGSAGNRLGTIRRPLTAHWNGTQWTQVDNLNANSAINTLRGVSATSSDDVWAVGWSGSELDAETLILHWDGRSWTVIPSPNIGTRGSALLSVTALSPNNVWAVGFSGRFYDRNSQMLTMKWDGQHWTIVPTPIVGSGGMLWSVDSTPNGDEVWAVGTSFGDNGRHETLTLRWNGTRWINSPSPTSTSFAELYGVAAISPTDVWAVGYYDVNLRSESLVLHWDGGQWVRVQSPNEGFEGNFLNAVAGSSGNDVWAVGQYTRNTFVSETLVMHWDGLRWGVVPSENLGPLYGLSLGSQKVWTVGERWSRTVPPASDGPLIEYVSGLCP